MRFPFILLQRGMCLTSQKIVFHYLCEHSYQDLIPSHLSCKFLTGLEYSYIV